MKPLNLICLSALLLFSCSVFSQQPELNGLDGYVNKFSGDVDFDIPVAILTGDHGEAYPIRLSYHNGGIQTNQEASWVGLGWSLSAGELTRSVSGFPDDFMGDQRIEYDGSDMLAKHKKMYGPIHFNQFPYEDLPYSDEHVMDIMVSSRNSNGVNMVDNDNTFFECPNFDSYSVNTSGLSGRLELEVYEFASIVNNMTDKDQPVLPGFASNTVEGWNAEFYKRPEFRLNSDYFESIYAPHYSREGGFVYGEFNSDHCETSYSPHGVHSMDDGQLDYYLPSPQVLQGCEFHGGITSEGVPKSGNRVFYFTNQEIYNHYFGSDEDIIENFIDAPNISPEDRVNPDMSNPNGIGAFQIHVVGGTVYHFSLPVYQFGETSLTFKSNEDYVSPSIFPVSNVEIDHLLSQDVRYASSWKLTAITNNTYEDVNSNHLVDLEDEGYWIQFNYGLHSASFNWRAPFYGFSYDQTFNEYHDPKWQTPGDEISYSSSYQEGSSEVYHINSIKTSKESVFFLKDLRKDGKSRPDINGESDPNLKLAKIIIVDSKYSDDQLFGEFGNYDSQGIPMSKLSDGFDAGELITMKMYLDNKDFIDQVSLSSVELEYDYSNCKKAYSNFSSDYEVSEEVIGERAFNFGNGNYEEVDLGNFQTLTEESFSSSDYSGSGKLTLNKIRFIGQNDSQIEPSINFEYYSEINSNPLDYDPKKVDYFGYYKSDAESNGESGFITGASKDFVKAWGLKSITYPLGAKVNFGYESDRYSVNASSLGGTLIPQPIKRTFRVKNADQFEIELFNNDAIELLSDEEFRGLNWSYHLDCEHMSTPVKIWYSSTDVDSDYQSFIESASGPNSLNFDGVSEEIGFPADNLISGCGAYNFDDDLYGFMTVVVSEGLGGGVRVNEVSVFDSEDTSEQRIELSYDNGVCAGEPSKFKDSFQYLRSNIDLLDPLSMGPDVGYSNVVINYLGDNNDSKGERHCHFHNYRDWQVMNSSEGRQVLWNSTVRSYNFVENHDFSGYAGMPISELILDEDGRKIYDQTYIYSDYTNQDNPETNQIWMKNTTWPENSENPEGYYYQFYKVFLQKKSYPYLRETVTTSSSDEMRLKTLERDPLSGIPTMSVSSHEYGDTYLTYNELAYHERPELTALAVNSEGLNQTDLISKSYRTTEDGQLISGSTTEWDDANLKLTYSNGALKGEMGEVEFHNKSGKTFNGEVNDDDWINSHHTTLLGPNDIALESIDVDGVYTAKKLDGSATRHRAYAVNANYFEFSHCGFESVIDYYGDSQFLEGDFTGVQYRRSVEDNISVLGKEGVLEPHTGEYFAEVSPSGGVEGPSFFMGMMDAHNGNVEVHHGILPGSDYYVSVWIHDSSHDWVQLRASLSGSDNVEISTDVNDPNNLVCGEWKKLELTISIPVDYTRNSDSDGLSVYLTNYGMDPVYIDDFRIQPVTSVVVAKIYDADTGVLRYELDNNNMTIQYLYDDKYYNYETQVETPYGWKTIAKTEKHYKREIE